MSRPKRTVAFVAVALVVGAAVLVLTSTRYLVQTKSGTAAMHATGLLQACEAYRNHPDGNGKYPMTLADLVAPPFGGPGGFLKNGRQDLIDPWGGQYRLAVVLDEGGEPVPYVWAEREKDGRLVLVGAKKAAGGGVTFGLSD
jgi:hypothetical protein